MTTLLCDANAIWAKAWYAANQEPASAVWHVLNLAIMCFNPNRVGERIDRAMFAWDGGQKKDKGREERPREYETTKQVAAEWFEFLFGATNVRLDGYEADDVLATAAVRESEGHVIIATGDKDLHQLSSEKISIFDVNAKGMVSRREILARWKVKRPAQVALALAIQGDSADKITGVKGWGPKKVEKLFERVTPEMDFNAAFNTILGQIPEDKQTEFLESLDLTLLNTEIEGVPLATPLNLVPPNELESASPEIVGHYLKVYGMYHEPNDDALRAFLEREGD